MQRMDVLALKSINIEWKVRFTKFRVGLGQLLNGDIQIILNMLHLLLKISNLNIHQ